MKNLIVVLAVLILGPNSIAQNTPYLNFNTHLNEKFVYDVSWSFIHLGTITLTTESIESHPDLLKVKVDIKTAPHLPFIDIDEYNVAVMRITDGMTIYYHGKVEEGGKDVDITCIYDDERNYTIYKVKDLKSGNIIKRDTVKSTKPYLIGTSLIQYARLIADSGVIRNVPTLLGGKFYSTTINYCGPVENIDIDAWPEPVSAFKYTGYADWKGKATAGLSGEFTGWLSNDNAKVVVYAEMGIFLGSIDVELEKWYKPGWTPPSYKILFTGYNN